MFARAKAVYDERLVVVRSWDTFTPTLEKKRVVVTPSYDLVLVSRHSSASPPNGVSPQRTWGVPIPALHDVATDEALLTSESLDHILAVLSEKAVNDGMVPCEVSLALPNNLAVEPAGKEQTRLLKEGPFADVYLEGSDQHHGWFQGSLLTPVSSLKNGQKPCAPYGTLITHGFVLDSNGKKMSKSLGNIISAMAIIQGG